MASIPTNRLKELRTASKLTQVEVAKILNKDFTLVSHHENSTKAIVEEDLKAYAGLFKVQTHEIYMAPVSST